MTRRSASREARSPAKGSNRIRRYRVRFTEWQMLAINLSAMSEHEAIAFAQDLWHRRGTAAFEPFDNGDAYWEAELLPAEPTLFDR